MDHVIDHGDDVSADAVFSAFVEEVADDASGGAAGDEQVACFGLFAELLPVDGRGEDGEAADPGVLGFVGGVDEAFDAILVFDRLRRLEHAQDRE